MKIAAVQMDVKIFEKQRNLEKILAYLETATQRVELERLGCDLGQGYHWSRPLPPDELAHWLEAPTPA